MLNKKLKIAALIFMTLAYRCIFCMEEEAARNSLAISDFFDLGDLSSAISTECVDKWHLSLLFGIVEDSASVVEKALNKAKKNLDQYQFQAWIDRSNEQLGHSALTLATENCLMDIVRLLRSFGANPRADNSNGLDAITIAEIKIPEKRDDLLAVLKSKNESLEIYDLNPMEPSEESLAVLQIMSLLRQRNKVSLCNILRQMKIKHDESRFTHIINSYDLTSGHTPLTLAIELEDISMIQLLLCFGADTELPNFFGLTAFDVARAKFGQGLPSGMLLLAGLSEFKMHQAAPSKIQKKNIAELLFHGLINGDFWYFDSILEDCVKIQYKDSVQEIVNIQLTDYNNLLLTLAVERQDFIFVEKLINIGADPLLKDKNGNDALSLAERIFECSQSEHAHQILNFLREKTEVLEKGIEKESGI